MIDELRPRQLAAPAIAAAGGAGLMGLTYAVSHSVQAILIIVVGLLLVAVLLLAYIKILKVMRARRAGPLERSVAHNAAVTPHGVNDPGRRARLDDVRKSFDAGVAKFRASGKNLYTFPWYILVGEPGGGKTEAIRQCGAGFPPGLQDPMQGTGGTINMNWWFTNSGVILDTAGRLMFEEVPPGSTSEWGELLKLLRTSRPNCPINGMLLVIPADSLMKDRSEVIDRKAGKIAAQLDQIQRELGVRFPVFILVTKCDLIAGFNEFFNSLDDAQQQSQILGWSNPASLDEPFQPDSVDAHLHDVRDRLIRHRYRLLLDPIHTEDAAGGRRIEEVDALYGLPDALTQLSTRLRRYLEQVFVSGAWSNKPLFLRGIYFTCAMQKGAALDLGLAATLGIPLEALPQGRVWQRDRAYFLRELFIKKIFVEKGLVTRANKANQIQRRRKIAVLATGVAATILLGLLTWLGYRQLDQSIEQHRAFWTQARNYALHDQGFIQIVQRSGDHYDYKGDQTVDVRNHEITAAQLEKDAVDLTSQPITIPTIFRPVAAAMLEGNFDDRRWVATQRFFESAVAVPTLHAAQDRLRTLPAAQWSQTSSDAFVTLTRFALAYEGGSIVPPVQPAERPSGPRAGRAPKAPAKLNLTQLLPFIDDKDPAAWAEPARKSEVAALQNAADAIYNRPGAWPPATLKSDPTRVDAIVEASKAFTAYWTARSTASSSPAVASLSALRKELADYQRIESELEQLANGEPPETTVAFVELRTRFTTSLDSLKASAKRVDDAYAAAKATLGTEAQLDKAYQAAIEAARKDAFTNIDALIKIFPDGDAAAAQGDRARLLDVRDRLQACLASIDDAQNTPAMKASLDEMAQLSLLLKQTQPSAPKLSYELRVDAFDVLAARLADPAASADKPASIEAIPTVLAQVDADAAHLTREASNLIGTTDAANPATHATNGASAPSPGKVIAFVVDAIARRDRTHALQAAMDAAPAGVEHWKTAVAERSKQTDVPARPSIAMSQMDGKPYDAAFTPEPFKSLAAAVAAAGTLIEPAATPTPVAPGAAAQPPAVTAEPKPILDRADVARNFDRCRSGFDEYRSAYNTYWSRTVFDDATSIDDLITVDWPTFSKKLAEVRSRTTDESLEALGEKARAALLAGGDQKSADKVTAGIERSQNNRLRDDVDKMLHSWRGLLDDSQTARQRLLAVAANDYASNFTVGTADQDPDYALRYWNNVSTTALTVLANDAKTKVHSDLFTLTQAAKFPLAHPHPNEAELTRDQLKPMLDTVQNIEFATVQAAGTIGAGATTGDAKIDGVLDGLRAKDDLAAAQKWLDALQQRLIALTDADGPLTCALTVLPPPEKNSIEETWNNMTVTQGKRLEKPVSLRAAGTAIGDILTPGDKVTFAFDRGKHVVDTSIIVDSGWPALRMLETLTGLAGAKQDAADRTIWTLNLALNDGGVERTQPIQLKFSKPIPALPDAPAIKHP